MLAVLHTLHKSPCFCNHVPLLEQVLQSQRQSRGAKQRCTPPGAAVVYKQAPARVLAWQARLT